MRRGEEERGGAKSKATTGLYNSYPSICCSCGRFVIKEGDIKGMLGSYSMEGKRGHIDLDGWVQFTLGFKGPFEIFDFRNSRVVERRNDNE